MKKILYGLLLLLSSCSEIAQDGTVSAVEETNLNNDYKYKVYVKKFVTSALVNSGDYYWFWTNEILMVGDTIHIGKVIKTKTNYED